MIDDGIAHNPQEMSLLQLKAKLYEPSGNVAKMNEAYQAMFTLRPQDAQLRIDLANIYLAAKQPDAAEASLRAGVSALPDNWEMKRQLVLFLGDHRSVESAEQEIRGYMR